MLQKNRPTTFILIAVLSLVVANVYAQKEYVQSLSQQNRWVDSVLKKLSRKQKIAQLFFVRAHTDKGKKYEDSVAEVIETQQLGGVVFFQGGPVRQANLI